MGRFDSFLMGAYLPIRSARLILKEPTLLLASLTPILITLFFYGYLFISTNRAIFHLLERIFTRLGIEPFYFLGFGFQILFLFLFVLIGAFSFSFVANLASLFFNDYLAYKTEAHATPPLKQVVGSGFYFQFKILGIDALKTILSLAANFLLFVLSFAPLVNLLVFFGTSLIMCFQFISYPQSRRGLGVRDGIHLIATHPYAALGFGSVITPLLSVPFLSSFCLPLAIVGGTLLFAEIEARPEAIL